LGRSARAPDFREGVITRIMASTPKARQVALFSDQEVRRDYLKSKQWVEQHMRIKVHRTGFAVAYEANIPKKREPSREPLKGRYQGSLFNQQKHKIADAVDWIRTNSKYKPRIFVATTPGYLDHPAEGKFIQKLVHNLKNGYGMENYVWVRELTAHGYPHWHFVADVPQFDPVDLSLYWSGLFDSTARNSIRCGTKPGKDGKRRFWVTSQRMSWYLTKYLGKSIGDCEKPRQGQRSAFRTFGISQEAGKASEPLVYHSRACELYNGTHQREFFLNDDQIEEGLPATVDPSLFSWRWTGHGQTYCGILKKKS
jgi:hypothetical protein